MVNIKQLIEANKHSYDKLSNPDAVTLNELQHYELVSYKLDPESDHGGLAYYHPVEKNLIVAHRGSATAKDWLKTDMQIALGYKETQADTAAMRFTEKVIEKLDAQGKAIDLIVQTGHSKGGREAQVSTKRLVETGDIPCMGVTFNSAMIGWRAVKDQEKADYPCTNLRVHGGAFFKIDPVSSVGQQLGHNIDVPLENIKTAIHAHGMGNFNQMIDRYPNTSSQHVRDVLNEIKKGIKLIDIELLYLDQQLRPKDLLAVQFMRNMLQENFKHQPDVLNAKLNTLNSKIPDIIAGKFQLPELPQIHQQADIEVINQSGRNDKSR